MRYTVINPQQDVYSLYAVLDTDTGIIWYRYDTATAAHTCAQRLNEMLAYWQQVRRLNLSQSVGLMVLDQAGGDTTLAVDMLPDDRDYE